MKTYRIEVDNSSFGQNIGLSFDTKKQEAMKRAICNEALSLLQQGEQAQHVLITEAQVRDLPEPMQRYLRYAGVVGKDPIRTVRLKQQGSLLKRDGATRQREEWHLDIFQAKAVKVYDVPQEKPSEVELWHVGSPFTSTKSR